MCHIPLLFIQNISQINYQSHLLQNTTQQVTQQNLIYPSMC